jgi:cation diffusion facilitator CzcD-associated flavoprotein CzcO
MSTCGTAARSPGWTGLRGALAGAPLTARVLRDVIYWALEATALGFAVHPALLAPVQARAQRHLARQVADPGLRARLTPDYTIGCKRILLSSAYYPALQRPNVDLVTDRITAITPSGLVTADGTAHPADVIIYATGFQVIESVTALNITGRDGVTLAGQGLAAYHGVTVPGFPNFFMLLGPNTGQGHTSAVFMIESQIQHIMSCLRILARDQAEVIEASPGRTGRYNRALQRRLSRAVWTIGGCTSWYLDESGVNPAIWPGFSVEYWARTRRARRAAYAIS